MRMNLHHYDARGTCASARLSAERTRLASRRWRLSLNQTRSISARRRNEHARARALPRPECAALNAQLRKLSRPGVPRTTSNGETKRRTTNTKRMSICR